MDKNLISTLEDWLSQSDPDAWLQAHPEHAEAVSPFRDLNTSLQSSARAHCMVSEPSVGAVAAGRSRLMAEVQGKGSAALRHWGAPARAGAMVAVAVVGLTLATGASALTGGGFGQAVLDVVSGPSDHEEGDHEGGINNAPDAADNGREHANDNAFEGRGNADDKAANGNGCETAGDVTDVNPNANPNAADRCDNADDGLGHGGDIPGAGAEHAADNAGQGLGNAPDTPPGRAAQ
ncbi:MAG TPA: hypothetical protein VFP63_08075 [Dehalococcoidia bacterium]|nr:hypothetical protein [Dehalococcoidia bacterium]